MTQLSDKQLMKIMLRRLDVNDNTLLLDSKQEKKLACVSQSIKDSVSHTKCDRDFWMNDGHRIFGNMFNGITEICNMAGYRSNTMPGFNKCIHDFLSIYTCPAGSRPPRVRIGQMKMQIETPRNNAGMSLDRSKILTRAMNAFTVGREEGCNDPRDFKCDADLNVSRQQATIQRENGNFVYRNISTSSDSWLFDKTSADFVKIGKKQLDTTHEMVLKLGDCIVIAPSNLSVLRIVLSDEDENDILIMMHELREKYHVKYGPTTTEEAYITLQLARANRNQDIFDRFNLFWKNKVQALGQNAIRFYYKAQLKHKTQTDTKIAKLSNAIKDLKTSLAYTQRANYYQEILADFYVCTSERQKNEIIQKFINILEGSNMKHKDRIEWHFSLYMGFMTQIENIGNANSHRHDPRNDVYMTSQEAGFSDEAGEVPALSRIEMQDGKQIFNQWQVYDMDESSPEIKKLTADEMHIWLINEENDYNDYIAWREAIIQRSQT